MKHSIDPKVYSGFDTAISASDWRYSAAIVGLHYYLEKMGKQYEIKKNIEIDNILDDFFLYHSQDITEKEYLQFVESFYGEELAHKALENKLKSKSTFHEEEIKWIKEKMSANTTLKKVFSKVKFTGENKQEILNLIQENREGIIKETFRNKKNLYDNYCQSGVLLTEAVKDSVCRVKGYYIDAGKKGKSMAYNFKTDTIIYEDDLIFDFIPFAFNGSSFETVFLNDNVDLEILIKMNYNVQVLWKRKEEERIEIQRNLMELLQSKTHQLKYGMEIIYKDREKTHFDSWYLRNESIKIFQKVNISKIQLNMKEGENYRNILKETFKNIMNLSRVDDTIHFLLKEKEKKINTIGINLAIEELLEINNRIKNGGEEMTGNIKAAKACAREVVKEFKKKNIEKKLDSYRQKLISSLVFRDYKGTLDILMQLSNYSGVSFGFVFDFIENPSQNDDLVRAFVFKLNSTEYEPNGKEEKKEDK